MSKPLILVVDDEPELRAILRDNLEAEGYEVAVAADGKQGVELALKIRPGLVLMDVMMPVMDGIEATRRLRAKEAWMPVVFLSARGDEVDRVLGLEIGGDDYVTKPFSMRELLSRIKAIFRRAEGRGASRKTVIGDAEIDFDTYRLVRPGGRTETLSHLEASLLECLVREKNKILDRARILDEVWGIEAYPTDRTVDNMIARLRKKLEPDPKKPRHILTVHGVGYKFVDA